MKLCFFATIAAATSVHFKSMASGEVLGTYDFNGEVTEVSGFDLKAIAERAVGQENRYVRL